MIYERDNVRFHVWMVPARPARTISGQDIPAVEAMWIFDAVRISDGHRLPGQLRLADDPSEFIEEMADIWLTKYPLGVEPPVVRCLSCTKQLVSDADTNYQFDNALWIGFHGGYGMFTDEMTGWPINDADKWVRDSDGDYRVDEDNRPIENPDYEPEYEEVRVLPGRPDHEAVICHECAHDLCVQVPWIKQLIQPEKSHSHRSAEVPRLRAEGHVGWDLTDK